MILKLDHLACVILRELILMEIDSCIGSARSARLRAFNCGDARDSDIALRYENRAEALMSVLDQLEQRKTS